LKRFYPHIALITVFIGAALFGVMTNSGSIGAFFGALAAMTTDPLLVLGAVVIGAVALRQRLLLPVAVAFAVALSLYIAYANASLGAKFTPFVVSVRVIAVLTIAYLANAIRLLADLNKRVAANE
jgi:hypothetical protein